MPQFSGVYTLSQVAEAVKSQNWTNIPPPNVEYLVVAGGGGGTGGTNGGGAGGGGGLLAGFAGITSGSAITVTVGAGGTGATVANASNGGNSVFGAVTATGGGAGGNAANGSSGGSGGSAPASGASYSGGGGISGQGNAGGNNDANSPFPGAGGGGAGTVGLNGVQTGGVAKSGDGGVGVASDLSGTRTVYSGGGGGGGTSQGAAAGNGGAGGGGNGGGGNANGTAGTANTGGGGGGAGNSSGNTGGNGGSGVVIISYPDVFAPAASTTGSPTVSTSGAGSLYFDGSGDYITYADNTLFKPGTGDFTIECWVYHDTAIGSINAYFTSATGGISFYRNASGKLEIGLAGTGTLLASTNNVTSNQWVHVAVSRSSVTLRLFINGAQEASGSNNTNFTFTGGCDIGGSGASFSMSGNISNFRFIKGSALYTGAFTVPTPPLTTVSGTSLLLNTVSGAPFADSSGNALTCTVTGSTAWNALSPIQTGAGFKNRVYRWTSSGSITF